MVPLSLPHSGFLVGLSCGHLHALPQPDFSLHFDLPGSDLHLDLHFDLHDVFSEQHFFSFCTSV